MFTLNEILVQLAQMEHEQNKENWDVSEEDDPLRDSPDAAVEHVRQFMMIKELLAMTRLDTS